jgi:cytochrome c peroxidase
MISRMNKNGTRKPIFSLLSLTLLVCVTFGIVQSRAFGFHPPIASAPKIVTSPLPQTGGGQTKETGQAVTPKVLLGRDLFFDKSLSLNRTVSCATCHDPASAFASRETLSIGVENRIGTRNAPTVLNSAFSKSYFWDGRAMSLEQQVKQPLLNAREMGMPNERALVERVASIREYRSRFRQVFPHQAISIETIASAIAAFERTLVSDNAPFDEFIRGNRKAITEVQKMGWELFKGKASCIDCHLHNRSTQLFHDFKFHNTGIRANDTSADELRQRAEKIQSDHGLRGLDSSLLAHNALFSDLGRFLVTRDAKDIGAFKTPTLRDVELTGPYMHDGSLKTLMDVVRFYNQGGGHNPMLDEKVRPLNLTEEEMGHIVEFLRSLTSDDVLRSAQSSKPQTRERIPPSPAIENRR